MAARQYHTALISNDIVDWINFDNDNPYLAKTPKSLRGINHPATRRLIPPQIHTHHTEDKKFLAKLANGKVRIEATDGPSFLYDPTKADPDDVEQGLFTGDFLLNVFYAIFFGKSSALTGKFCRNSIADRNGMRKVTGRNIAYAAVQVLVLLFRLEKWDVLDGHFNYVDFYSEIVDFFEEYPDDEGAVDLLDWWNEQVFGHHNGRNGTPETRKDTDDEDEDPPEPSSASLARAARKARNEKAKTGTLTPND